MTVTAENALWTLLPNGFADRAATVARLSLVASPRVVTASGRLDEASLVADWPSQISQLGALKVRTLGSTEQITATIVSPPPRADLWRALFRPQTPVDLAGVTAALKSRKDASSRPVGIEVRFAPNNTLPRTHPAVLRLTSWAQTNGYPVTFPAAKS